MPERESAGGDRGLVRSFVNTVDLQDGPEELRDPNTLKTWLVARRLMDPSHPVDEGDLRNAIAVRESIRGVIGANSGFSVYPTDLATLNQAATASRLRMRFAAAERARLAPHPHPLFPALAQLS